MRNTEKFWEMVQEKFFIDECGELEYDEFLEIGEECGLLETVKYDPEVHNFVVGEVEPGDMIYVPVPEAKP